MADLKTVLEGGIGEYEEKKSRFIAEVRPVTTESEATEFLNEIRKKYWDARHNCYAYVIGERGELQRSSDDGEPSGTAGRPILEVINGAGLHNTAIVVTRYFGGTLLGTGGLIRAYTKVSQEALAHSTIAVKKEGIILEITADYTMLSKIQYYLGDRKIRILDSIYAEKVIMKVILPVPEKETFRSAIQEITAGQAIIKEIEACMYTE